MSYCTIFVTQWRTRTYLCKKYIYILFHLGIHLGWGESVVGCVCIILYGLPGCSEFYFSQFCVLYLVLMPVHWVNSLTRKYHFSAHSVSLFIRLGSPAIGSQETLLLTTRYLTLALPKACQPGVIFIWFLFL